jgi:RHS repeat-associated protein
MVYDASNSPQGFKDNENATPFDEEDYTYDANGNMTADANKGITEINYNHLNLPTEIIYSSTKKISYLYDASGSKLQKVVTSGASVVSTDYLDGYQYRNGILQFFGTSEGYVTDIRTKIDPTTQKDNYNYVYNYLDHLGNVRMSYSYNETQNVLKIIEENGYYPYGMKHEAYNTVLNRYKAVLNDTKVELKGVPSGGDYTTLDDSFNKYRFNGQEYQSELGLNITAMDYRQYDNALGRFNCVDMVTHFSQTPYQFGNGNPMYWADPTGLFGEGSTWIENLWNASGSGTTWNNTGSSFTSGDISIDHNGASNMFDAETGIAYEGLGAVTVGYNAQSLNYAANAGGIIQMHLYTTGKYYQDHRDRFFSNQVDELQDYFGAIGAVDPTGIVDGLNSLGYLARGQKANAAIAALGIIPYAGDLAKGVKYTKSTMAIGREVHAAYNAGKIGKEFRLLSGKRIDFLDIENGIIHELKPFNPRAMKAGEKQLQMYLKELQSPAMLEAFPQFNGIQWKTILETY